MYSADWAFSYGIFLMNNVMCTFIYFCDKWSMVYLISQEDRLLYNLKYDIQVCIPQYPEISNNEKMNYKVQMWSILSFLTIKFNLKLTIDTIVLLNCTKLWQTLRKSINEKSPFTALYAVVFKTLYIEVDGCYKLQNWVEILEGSYTLSM